MKFLLMVVVLFILADPVLAQSPKNNSECLKIYGTYMNEYGTSKHIPNKQMLNFIDQCLPTENASHNTQQHQKLLRNIDDDKRYNTVKT